LLSAPDTRELSAEKKVVSSSVKVGLLVTVWEIASVAASICELAWLLEEGDGAAVVWLVAVGVEGALEFLFCRNTPTPPMMITSIARARSFMLKVMANDYR
jgi:hypothetical protein